MFRHSLFAASILAALLPLAANAAGTRTHVSNAGSDANTAFSCDSAHPCRTFAAALTQTTPGGEILAIDSSGYGKVVIDRSVSIIAAPGVFAGIGVGAGGNATGIEIATAGVNVALRGLTITGQGGTYGIAMTNGASLTLEDCATTHFPGGNGVHVATAAKVSISNHVSHRNALGIFVTAGATASISRSRIHDNTSTGIHVTSSFGTVTTAAITGSVITGNFYGVAVTSHVAGGVMASIGSSTVSNGAVGLHQAATTGIGILESAGNNQVSLHTSTNTSGTIITVPPM